MTQGSKLLTPLPVEGILGIELIVHRMSLQFSNRRLYCPVFVVS